ncbi:hypothetical protein [Thermomonospora cellulosilytica]|uniref:Uncharacterized protein n=1 Tax=Thermomonospora cellulosilytica TaxID=1411118 RepID=A0A7W3RAJ8_9ACTN|nr:hypothetical protein [Thermomonospora cellulosilytica]MBA9005942.1 hypothetical protein [Thermomonospora cellulosilytica]
MSPKANAVLVEALSSSLRYGGNALKQVPDLVKQILAEGAWREFVTPRGELVRHDRFVDFVTAPPTRGIGATVDLVRRLVADDTQALDLLDQALQNPSSHHAGNNIPSRPEGTSQAKALRRLRKDRPDLHAQVLAGELSAHAAMIKAGFRPKTFTVRGDRPDSIARTLRKNLSPEQLAELRQLLDE